MSRSSRSPLGILAGLVVLGGVVYGLARALPAQRGDTLPMANTSGAASSPNRSDILARLVVSKRQYRGRSGDPLTASFTLENKNDVAIKDFTIRFIFYGNSGTMISSRDKTFYELLPAKGSKRFKDERLGFMPDQGTSVSAEVVDYGAP